ncbi:unnamed protein product [Durusdinium trenchii]|uniref:Uncharacterized protein n=1 Tax=Durusdinium trenchii TaxID=1381693 RepID=A0ABP0LRV4_9DINO
MAAEGSSGSGQHVAKKCLANPKMEGLAMSAICRPVHGGYPQPTNWSAWPWCTDSLSHKLFCGRGVCEDVDLQDGARHSKRTWLQTQITEAGACDNEPKRRCMFKACHQV